jgi:hypothetical protein
MFIPVLHCWIYRGLFPVSSGARASVSNGRLAVSWGYFTLALHSHRSTQGLMVGLGQQLAAAQSFTDHAAPDRSIRALVIQRHVHSFQSSRGVRVYLSSCYLVITNFRVPIRISCTFCFLKGSRYKEELLHSMTYLVKVQLLA